MDIPLLLLDNYYVFLIIYQLFMLFNQLLINQNNAFSHHYNLIMIYNN
jgi:hypothetical protein